MYTHRNYTVFGDSKCQYKIRDQKAKISNLYIDKKFNENLRIYHSYTKFSKDNVDRRSKNFEDLNLLSDKTVFLNEYILVINVGDEPISFQLTEKLP